MLDIVEACIALEERNINYDLHDLMVIDLTGQSIPTFIKAFLKAYSQYMDLTLAEFKQRHMIGENVVENAMKYRFEPWKHMKSWRVRITHAGIGLEEIKRIKQSNSNGLVEVFDPNTERWLKADEIKL